MVDIANQRGFSLVEVVIALSIFTVGLLAVASMQMQSVSGNFSARNASESSYLAQNMVNELSFRPYAHADLISDVDGDGTVEIELTEDLNGNGSIDDDDVHSQVINSVEGNYVFRWGVDDNVTLDNTKTITLDVQYPGGGVQKQTRLVFVKADVI